MTDKANAEPTEADWAAIQAAVGEDCPLSIVASVCEDRCSWEEAANRIEAYAAAAFNAAAAHGPALPEGMVPVPKEPTDEMLDAGHAAGDFHILHYDGIDKPGTPRYSLKMSWAAMLAAAKEGKSRAT